MSGLLSSTKRILVRARLRWRNNRNIARLKPLALLGVTAALALPSSAFAGAPVVTGKGWRTPGEGYIFEVKVYSRWADWAYIRMAYPYWGEYAQMTGPYWHSAASGEPQMFAYAARYSGCGPIRLQVAVENYGHITWTETSYINTCTFTAVSEG